MKRRDFLRTVGVLAAGAATAPRYLQDVARVTLRRSAELEGNDKLPQRTIGLRSLGGDFRFDPAGLRIERGGRVVWLNMGDFHTTSAFHPDNSRLLEGDVPLRIPRGAKPWHSGMLGLDAGTEFEHTFEIEGVYDYFCQPHYGFGMVGRIIVTGPNVGPIVGRPLSELNEPSRKAMPEVEEIMGPGGRTFEWMARINGLLLLRAHDEPLESAVSAVSTAIDEDEELGTLLAEARVESEFHDRLDSLASAATGTGDYESLLSRADAVKEVLHRARSPR